LQADSDRELFPVSSGARLVVGVVVPVLGAAPAGAAVSVRGCARQGSSASPGAAPTGAALPVLGAVPAGATVPVEESCLLVHWGPLAAGQRRSRWARLRTSP